MSQNNTFAISDLSAGLVAGHSNMFTVEKGMITSVRPGIEGIMTLTGIDKVRDLDCIVKVLHTIGAISDEQANFFNTGYATVKIRRAALVQCWHSGDFSGLKDLSAAGLDGSKQHSFESAAELPFAENATNGLEALSAHFGAYEIGDFAGLPKGRQGDFGDMVKMLLSNNVTTWRLLHDKMQDEGQLSEDMAEAYSTVVSYNEQAKAGTDREVKIGDDTYSYLETSVRGQSEGKGRLNRKSRIIFTVLNESAENVVMSVNLSGPAQGTISRIA